MGILWELPNQTPQPYAVTCIPNSSVPTWCFADLVGAALLLLIRSLDSGRTGRLGVEAVDSNYFHWGMVSPSNVFCSKSYGSDGTTMLRFIDPGHVYPHWEIVWGMDMPHLD